MFLLRNSIFSYFSHPSLITKTFHCCVMNRKKCQPIYFFQLSISKLFIYRRHTAANHAYICIFYARTFNYSNIVVLIGRRVYTTQHLQWFFGNSENKRIILGKSTNLWIGIYFVLYGVFLKLSHLFKQLVELVKRNRLYESCQMTELWIRLRYALNIKIHRCLDKSKPCLCIFIDYGLRHGESSDTLAIPRGH